MRTTKARDPDSPETFRNRVLGIRISHEEQRLLRRRMLRTRLSIADVVRGAGLDAVLAEERADVARRGWTPPADA